MEKFVTEMIVRTMREGGFVGDIQVSNIVCHNQNITAEVVATIGGGMASAEYLAIIENGGKVRVRKVVR